MRISTLLFIATLMQVSASTLAQKVTLNESNTSPIKVFNKISKQTGYDFWVTGSLLQNTRPVTINVRDAELEDALDSIFKDQPLTYRINEKTILIKEKSQRHEIVSVIPTPVAGITVSGLVRDTVNSPIPGATVRMSPGNVVTATDKNGIFSFKNVPSGSYTLTISSIGYLQLKNRLDVRENIRSTLTEYVLRQAVSVLNEVSVNTGYQKIKPEQSTGSVSQLSTKEYESRISTNFLDGLVNKLPGLMINNDVKFTSNISGTARSNSLFNIRGISTLTGNQNPLLVIDGYPTELSLNMIDPNEIKSVTVLKDAAAATVYGVRASNGVIVIERKQASRGKPQISFRATLGLTPKENYSRYRWAPEASLFKVNYQRDIYKNSINAATLNSLSAFAGRISYPAPYYIVAQQAAGAITAAEAESAFVDLSGYDNAKDYSRFFLRTAATQTYNLNMSGGSDNALYYITANYTDNSLQQIKNGNNRLLLSGRTTLKFSPRLSLELNTDYQQERYRGAPVQDINKIYPYERFEDASGKPLATQNGSFINPFYNRVLTAQGLADELFYPLVEINEVSDLSKTFNNRITANFNYKIGGGFDLSFGGIYESSRTDQRHLASVNSSEARQYVNSYASKATDGSINYTIPAGGFLQQQNTYSNSYTARAQLNYNKRHGDHSFNGILGGELRDVTSQGNSAAYFGYNDQTLLQQAVNYGNITSGTIARNLSASRTLNYNDLFYQLYTDDRYISAYSNMVYSFRDTYSLSGSIRVDQSNLFGTDPRYKYKPLWSLGAAWNIHKESFMENLAWINQLKLRVADGFNGNVAKKSLPQAIAKSLVNTLTYPATPALALASYANSGLRWEQTHNFNAGLDYQIFGRINGSIDYYLKNSTNLLAGAFIDPTIGTSPSIINSASIRNQGLELNLHADWITTKRFNWNTGLVLARNSSKVLDVYQNISQAMPSTLNGSGYLKGYPVGALFAYHWAGLDGAGNPQVRDQNDGKVYSIGDATTFVQNSTHLYGKDNSTYGYVGSAVPTVNAGLSNRLDIGNFYVYAMVNYYGGFKVFVPQPNPAAMRPLAGAGNYWKQPGDEAHTDIMSLAAAQFGGLFINNYTDNYLVNGDYLTLADLTVSYSFSNSAFMKRAGFKHFEVKMQASNLYTVGLNKYNFSAATGSYAKSYLTPTYSIGIFTNF